MNTAHDLENAVAIVGMAGRFPGARNLEQFWRNLRDGVDSVRLLSDEEIVAMGVSPSLLADPGYVRASAQPDGIDLFDANFFGINAREAEILDPQQRVMLEVAWEAMEDAGYDPAGSGRVVGVFAGQTLSTYLLFNLMPDAGLRSAMDPLQLLVGNTGDSLATRVSYKLNLQGPSYTVQSACSTSLVAVHNACQSLLAGECDMALAGAVSLNVSLLGGYVRKEGSVFSPDGRCRAFDARAQGILFGGGAGLVVLKRLEDAITDGDTVRAVILGSAVNNDGAFKVGYTAPSVEGQAGVIAEALGAAGVAAESLSYIEAHGTGTRLGDPIEIQALTKAFRSETGRRGFIPMGSVKTNVGHLDVAAGIAGLMKTVLAMEHREIPPSLHFHEANPEIDFAASPVYINTELRPWQAAPETARRAGLSSFGFGGTNVHMILEEAPPVPVKRPEAPATGAWHLLPLSAKSESALAAVSANLAAHLAAHPELSPADVAHTLQVGRRPLELRRVVACRVLDEAIVALRSPDSPVQTSVAPLDEAARSWRAGQSVDWAALPGAGGRRVPLPTYPFERQSYWIATPGAPRPLSVAESRDVSPLPIAAPESATVADVADPMLAMAASPAQTFHPRPNLFNPYVPPSTEAEGKVVAIWQEVLGVEPVGVHDNFFQLGGHSLLATQILSRVRESFAIEFPLQHLFTFPTAAELAEAIVFMVQEAAAGQGGEGVSAMTPSPLRAAGGPYPLSFAQERIWFLDQLEPGTPAFDLPAATRLQGRLDRGALELSLNEVVRRHETLRTRFPTVDGQVVQEVLPALHLELPLADLSVLPGESRAAEERRLILEHSSRPFDLARGPLVAFLLLRLTPEDHLLSLVMHHIVSDGWSLGVLQSEVARHYRRACQALLPSGEPLAELPYQYADYADWQRRHFQGEVLEHELAYWRPRLQGVPFLELRGDRPRPPVQTFRGGYEDFALPAELARSLEALAQHEGSSLFMVLLSGFGLLLQRHAQQDDFAVGALIAGRNRSELEGMIGCFVNNLALRTDLSGEPDGRELLRRVRKTTLEAYAHQDVPFEKLLEELQPERDLSRGALIQVMFNLLNFPTVHEELPGLTMSSSGVRGERANFDLTLWMTEARDGLVGWLEYNADLFDRATARRMTAQLRLLLEGLAGDPARRVAELPLLAEAERRQVLVEWNRTGRERPWEQGFLGLFQARVASAPGNIAAVCQGDSLTYGELDRRSRRLASWLTAHGVGPESVVPILANRGLDFLAAVLGVLTAGGAYLPLDPHQPAFRAVRVLRQSGAALVLVGSDHALRLVAASEGGELLPDLVAFEGLLRDESIAPAPAAEVRGRVLPDNLAYVIFTSGSTGIPKGAMLTHRGMLNHLLAKVEELEITAADVVAQNASQSFDISVWQLLSALVVGGRVHIVLDDVAHEPARLLAEAEAGGVTILEVVPSVLGAMLTGDGSPSLRSLRWMIPTGEALPPELARRWLEAYPEVPLLNAYGPTECSDDVSHHPLREVPEGAIQIPIGRPVGNTRLYVLDRGLRPLPAGVAGELCVGGAGVGRGYLLEPGRTAEAFVPDPFAGLEGEEPGGRLYRTGDLTRLLPDGTLEFLGRIDHQVKVRGFRIELGEVEAVLGEHPALRQAVVAALDIEGGGHAGKRLVGYVVLRADIGAIGAVAPDAPELRRFVAERLPDYMVPSAFVVLPDIPLTAHGKVDRRALPVPELARAEGDEPFVAPRNEVEEAVAEIWKEVLKIERVGAFDSFFALGGHSLVAAQVAAKIRTLFEVELPLRTLFEAPTLGELALAVEELMIARIEGLSEEELAELL